MADPASRLQDFWALSMWLGDRIAAQAHVSGRRATTIAASVHRRLTLMEHAGGDAAQLRTLRRQMRDLHDEMTELRVAAGTFAATLGAFRQAMARGQRHTVPDRPAWLLELALAASTRASRLVRRQWERQRKGLSSPPNHLVMGLRCPDCGQQLVALAGIDHGAQDVAAEIARAGHCLHRSASRPRGVAASQRRRRHIAARAS